MERAAEAFVAEYVAPTPEEPTLAAGPTAPDPGATPPVDAWGEDAAMVLDAVPPAEVIVDDDQVESDGEVGRSESDESKDQVEPRESGAGAEPETSEEWHDQEEPEEPEEWADRVEGEEPHDSDEQHLTEESGEVGDGAEEPLGPAAESDEVDDA